MAGPKDEKVRAPFPPVRNAFAATGLGILACALAWLLLCLIGHWRGSETFVGKWPIGVALWLFSWVVDILGDLERCDPRDPKGVYGCESVPCFNNHISLFALRYRKAEGMLYATDTYGGKVTRVKLGKDGKPSDGANTKEELVVKAPPKKAGEKLQDLIGCIAWAKDKMYVAMVRQRSVMSVAGIGEEATLEPYADISSIEKYQLCNLTGTTDGRLYTSGLGGPAQNNLKTGMAVKATIAMVEADGTASIQARQLMFPRSMVITPDGKTMIFAETFNYRLTAFDRNPETGELSNRRVWAEMPGALLDVVCLDAEGCLWVTVSGFWLCNLFTLMTVTAWSQIRGQPVGGWFRVREGGEILEHILLKEHTAVSCYLVEKEGGGGVLYMSASSISAANEKDIMAASPGNCVTICKDVPVGPALVEGDANYHCGFC